MSGRLCLDHDHSLSVRLVVYTPQIIENYRRKSGEGLSVIFVVIWLIGDLFNLFGAILTGLLPTVIILAVYVSEPKMWTKYDISKPFSTPSATRFYCFRYISIDGLSFQSLLIISEKSRLCCQRIPMNAVGRINRFPRPETPSFVTPSLYASWWVPESLRGF